MKKPNTAWESLVNSKSFPEFNKNLERLVRMIVYIKLPEHIRMEFVESMYKLADELFPQNKSQLYPRTVDWLSCYALQDDTLRNENKTINSRKLGFHSCEYLINGKRVYDETGKAHSREYGLEEYDLTRESIVRANIPFILAERFIDLNALNVSDASKYCFYKFKVDGYSTGEIANKVGCSDRHVRRLIARVERELNKNSIKDLL